MARFRFDPVSLVLEMPEPGLEAFRGMDPEEGAREVSDFNSRYLHERIHWIQHFSTFSGLLQIFNAEIQQLVLEQAMARLEDSPLPTTPPLRQVWGGEPELLVWEALELFGAAMAGDRKRAHFETDYGPGWSTRLLDGAQLFSRVFNQLRERGFRFDGTAEASFAGVSVGRAEFIEDDFAHAVGSSILFELHAGLGQLAHLQAGLGRLPGAVIDPVAILPRRVVELRDRFLDEAGLPDDDWRSDVVCSIAAYFALNTPVAPFFPAMNEKKSLTDLSGMPNFMGMARRLAPLQSQIERGPSDDVFAFHRFALDLMAGWIGPEFFEVNLKLLGMAVGEPAYLPFVPGEGTVLSLENDRTQYLAATARRLVDIARDEPIFVTCPGHLYAFDRARFGDIYAQITHSLEFRHEVGILPSPHFSRQLGIGEYARQVALAFKADLCRALAHGDIEHALTKAGRYRASHPNLADVHAFGLRAAMHDLVLPPNIQVKVSRVLELEDY